MVKSVHAGLHHQCEASHLLAFQWRDRRGFDRRIRLADSFDRLFQLWVASRDSVDGAATIVRMSRENLPPLGTKLSVSDTECAEFSPRRRQDLEYHEAIAALGPALRRLPLAYEEDAEICDLLQDIHLALRGSFRFLRRALFQEDLGLSRGTQHSRFACGQGAAEERDGAGDPRRSRSHTASRSRRGSGRPSAGASAVNGIDPFAQTPRQTVDASLPGGCGRRVDGRNHWHFNGSCSRPGASRKEHPDAPLSWRVCS